MIPPVRSEARRKRLRLAAAAAGTAALVGAALATGAFALGGDSLEAGRATGGGGAASDGGQFALRSSIGQHDAGELSSGGYTLRGGILGAAHGVAGSGTVTPSSPSPSASPSPTASASPSPTASVTPGPAGPEKRYLPLLANDGTP